MTCHCQDMVQEEKQIFGAYSATIIVQYLKGQQNTRQKKEREEHKQKIVNPTAPPVANVTRREQH